MRRFDLNDKMGETVFFISKRLPKSLIWLMFVLGYGVIYFGPPFINVILGMAMIIVASVALLIRIEGWK